MPEENRTYKANRIILAAACMVILIAGLKLAQSFFIPILLAAFIATVSFPITNWLRRHRVPRFFAVLITVLVDFAFLLGIVLIASSMVGDLETKYAQKYRFIIEDRIKETSETAVAVLERFNVEEAEQKVQEYGTSKLQEQLSDTFSFTKVLDLGTDVAWKVFSFMGTTFIVLILTVFMLSEARMFARRMNAILDARGPNLQRIMDASSDVQRYLAIKTVISLVTGLLAGFLCWAAKIDFFLLWGILAFAMNFIPVIGSIIAGIAPLVLAFLVGGPASALVIGIGYVSINIFLGNFLEPMLMGRRFGLSTLVVLISVLFWGYIWGPIGMLLAVPLTMVIKVMLDNSDDLRWLAVAITKEKRRPILVPEDEEDEGSNHSLAGSEMGHLSETATEGGQSS
ncbi:MAG: AI-2E family transporter [Akkermansiaceae bacterium]